MDSTNSGSIQSSSSGDDYYDSRTEAISSSLNLPPQPPPPPPPPPPSSFPHLHHHPSPSSISPWPHVNTFPSTPPLPNPLSLDMTWARSLPPSSLLEHSCTILDGLTTTTSSSSKTMAVAALGRSPPSGSSSLNPSVQLPTQLPARPTATPRGSKKRSRASRRAPTTVLATDTSNFRAMVQEFTGFPAAPFIYPPFSRPRLDLFHSATTAPAYRPFGPLAPKLQAPLFAPVSSPSSSMAHGAAYFSRISVANANTSAASTCSNTSSCSSATSSSNYQLPSVLIQHPNLLNMESPDFTFHSSLHPQTLPYHNPPTMPAAFEANPSRGPYSDLAAGGPGSLIAMEGLKPRRRADGFLAGWADGSPSQDRDRSQLFRSVIGNYDNLQQLGNHAEKGSESMTLARGEGRVDPWILSSD